MTIQELITELSAYDKSLRVMVLKQVVVDGKTKMLHSTELEIVEGEDHIGNLCLHIRLD